MLLWISNPYGACVKNFLIIDDNTFDIGHLRAVLHMVRGYEIDVRSATSAKEALQAVRERAPDVVFADHLSATDTAFSTMERLRKARNRASDQQEAYDEINLDYFGDLLADIRKSKAAGVHIMAVGYENMTLKLIEASGGP